MNRSLNNITIEGSDALLAEIHEYVHSETSKFDFDKILTFTENFFQSVPKIQTVSALGKENFSYWRDTYGEDNWNVEADYASPEEYSIEAPWEYCELVLTELAHMFPAAKIIHTYEGTENVFFSGRNVFENGRLVFSSHGICHEMYKGNDDISVTERFIGKYVLPPFKGYCAAKFIPIAKDTEWTYGQIFCLEERSDEEDVLFNGIAKFKGEQPKDHEWF